MSDKSMINCSYCNQTLPKFAQRCPRCEHDVTIGAQDNVRKQTILESLHDEPKRGSSRPANNRSADSSSNVAPRSETVVPYRPVCRPRRAMLCIVDDGADDGEWIRIRTGLLRIGRTEGDVLIGDDPKISSRHAEIRREVIGGYSRWILRDLKSRNGTFVRIESAKLAAGSELIIGLRRFAFQLPQVAPGSAESSAPLMTQGWSISEAVRASAPKLVEIDSETPLEFSLSGTSFRIGTNASECNLVISDDPTVDPIHAEINLDESGDWKMTSHRSLNGTWMRVEEVVIDRTCRFQLGEQRFKIRVQ